ncbi:MAG: YceI family protein [Pseudomonadota bacterium]
MKILPLFFIAIGLIISAPQNATAQMTDYQDMPAGVYNLDETHAMLIWRVSHLGLSNYTARFTDFDADLTFDPENPENSQLVATVNPMSVETDYPYPERKDFDKVLATGEDWFNAGNFPKIEYKSRKITHNGDNTGTIEGDLTLLSVTMPLTLDVTFNGAMAEQPFSKKPTLGFSATGTMKRSDWGMGAFVPNIGDEVELIIEAEFGMEPEASENEGS